MYEDELIFLEKTASIDIFLYNKKGIQKILQSPKHYNHNLMIRASKLSKEGFYSLVKYNSGYMLLVPLRKEEGLILSPKIDSLNNSENSFSNIDFINHSTSLAKLTYFLYSKKSAPNWNLVIYNLNEISDPIKQVQPMKNLHDFHRYANKMVDSFARLDEKNFKMYINKMKKCQVFGDALTTGNVIRGEKDILIDIISKLTDRAEKEGLPFEKDVFIQSVSVQKIELQANILNFNGWLEEIPYAYFDELKKWRENLFIDKADKIERYLKINSRENIKLKDISNELRISEQSLNTIFKKKYGTTIKQYLTKLKIENAKELLTTTQLKIHDISEYLSFVDESYFISTFNKSCGMTPSKYRQKLIDEFLADKN
ncbi:AraC family transcriptional regulator [Oenococcus oeni]|uniref:AraC family transcriptional regulator n=1 Tax=Oenococcus oeni TaxID=1247 RepID=A0A6N4A027_OENOE|nr:response regulator transcription factor [Oenococcus oeni]OIM20757.1 AraC family transcriptional regulator [Oenococcus oeni]